MRYGIVAETGGDKVGGRVMELEEAKGAEEEDVVAAVEEDAVEKEAVEETEPEVLEAKTVEAEMEKQETVDITGNPPPLTTETANAKRRKHPWAMENQGSQRVGFQTIRRRRT